MIPFQYERKITHYGFCYYAIYYSNSTKVESRTQGSRPRPRTQKKFEAKNQEHNAEVISKKELKQKSLRSKNSSVL